jgi:RNA polymerase-binding protein DksA
MTGKLKGAHWRLCGNLASTIGALERAPRGYRDNPKPQDLDASQVGCGDIMATVLGEEIDVLAKAKRSIAGDYAPGDAEPYMSEPQVDYYRRLLLEWKKLIHSAAQDTLQQLQDGPISESDLNDRASSETDWGIELRTRDRQRKLISKIDSALRRIWLLRSNRRADRFGSALRPPNRDHDGRSAGSPRTPRENLPRRLIPCLGVNCIFANAFYK